jgi:hypothetical protein
MTDAELFSGDAGDVTNPWRRAKRTLGEAGFEAIDRVAGVRRRADALARATPRRRVLVAGIYRPGSRLELEPLRSERHEVSFALGATEDAVAPLAAETVAERLAAGKLANLNRVLGRAAGAEGAADARDPAAAPGDFDWLLVVDDDVRLPPRFLDRFLAVCERFRFDLAQPAQSQLSHSAWRVTRRRPASLARETRFVEIGPVTAFARRAADELLPFPELRFGWGLDLHWAAVAAERGWRLGVVDATPVRHEDSPVAAAYSGDEARTEAAGFLADRPHLPATQAGDVLATHRRA